MHVPLLEIHTHTNVQLSFQCELVTQTLWLPKPDFGCRHACFSFLSLVTPHLDSTWKLTQVFSQTNLSSRKCLTNSLDVVMIVVPGNTLYIHHWLWNTLHPANLCGNFKSKSNTATCKYAIHVKTLTNAFVYTRTGNVHGGCVASFVDECSGFAAFTHQGTSHMPILSSWFLYNMT